MLNSHQASIKVKSVINKQTIDFFFLDTTVYKGPNFHNTGQFDFKVFFKETDTHLLRNCPGTTGQVQEDLLAGGQFKRRSESCSGLFNKETILGHC